MLVLARRVNESIMIGDQIEVSIVEVRGEHVKIGIKAPPRVKVYRQEVYQAIQEENRQAAQAAPGALPSLDDYLSGRKQQGGPEAGGGAGGQGKPSQGGGQGRHGGGEDRAGGQGRGRQD